MSAANEAIVSTMSVVSSSNTTHNLEYIVGAVVAIAILRTEVMRHAAGFRQGGISHTSGGFMNRCKALFCLYAPEAAGVAACLGLVIYLRINYSSGPDVNEQVWEQITSQWPILLTADTLLAIQAMLRLLLLCSCVLRPSTTPVANECALIFLGAALGRSALAAHSKAYLLDGPVGGYLPVACEVLSVPLLAILSRGVCKKAVLTSVITLAVAARIASRNHLTLGDEDTTADALFIFAHIAELLAAFAYLSRTLVLDIDQISRGKGIVALQFAHLIMPFQQCLAAYYFVQAFEYAPELVGAGHPFEILRLGGVAQLGVFAGAAVLYIAECLESPAEESVPNHSTEQAAQASESASAPPQRLGVRAATL